MNGKTFRYSVKEVPFSGLAHQARALNVKATGYAEVTVWSVVYRADGFAGAVTIVGPGRLEGGRGKPGQAGLRVRGPVAVLA